jgi:malate dehydrogenase (oxaloacetate-decarboxylating)(NADP+)
VDDIGAYKERLDGSVFRSALIMRPVFAAASRSQRRIVFAEGEDERVLRTAQSIIEEMTDRPVLIGRPDVIAHRCARAGLTIRPGEDFELVNPEDDPRHRKYWEEYLR